VHAQLSASYDRDLLVIAYKRLRRARRGRIRHENAEKDEDKLERFQNNVRAFPHKVAAATGADAALQSLREHGVSQDTLDPEERGEFTIFDGHLLRITESLLQSDPDPAMIVLSRDSGDDGTEHRLVLEGSGILANLLVAEEYCNVQSALSETDPRHRPFRRPASIRSIHTVNAAGYTPPTIGATFSATTPEQEFIDEMDRNYSLRPRPVVYVLIRGVEGFTVREAFYPEMIRRWPDITVRFAFAVKQYFLTAEPLDRATGYDIQGYWSDMSELGLCYSEQYDLHKLRRVIDGESDDPSYQQLLRWWREADDWRNGALIEEEAQIVRARGAGRNHITIDEEADERISSDDDEDDRDETGQVAQDERRQIAAEEDRDNGGGVEDDMSSSQGSPFSWSESEFGTQEQGQD